MTCERRVPIRCKASVSQHCIARVLDMAKAKGVHHGARGASSGSDCAVRAAGHGRRCLRQVEARPPSTHDPSGLAQGWIARATAGGAVCWRFQFEHDVRVLGVAGHRRPHLSGFVRISDDSGCGHVRHYTDWGGVRHRRLRTSPVIEDSQNEGGGMVMSPCTKASSTIVLRSQSCQPPKRW